MTVLLKMRDESVFNLKSISEFLFLIERNLNLACPYFFLLFSYEATTCLVKPINSGLDDT